MLLDYRSEPQIPDGWRIEPIERLIIDIGDGGTPSRDDAGHFGGGVAWAVIDDIDKNITSTKETLTARGVSNSNAKVWPPGSVIVSTGATIGRVGVTRVPLATKQGITGIVPNRDLIEAEYLATVLRAGTSVLERFAQGSTFKEIRPPTMVKLRMRLPPVDEQSRIAAVLDTIDEGIAKTEAVIAKLKQVRAGLLHDLLTRGLDENGQLRDPVAHPEQFQDSPAGRIPKEWHCSKFDDVVEGIDAGKSPDYPDQPAPAGEWGVLKVSAIWPEGFRAQENKRVTKAMHQIPALQIRDGDLLISRSNTYELVGLVCIVSNAPTRLMLCDKTLRLRL